MRQGNNLLKIQNAGGGRVRMKDTVRKWSWRWGSVEFMNIWKALLILLLSNHSDAEYFADYGVLVRGEASRQNFSDFLWCEIRWWPKESHRSASLNLVQLTMRCWEAGQTETRYSFYRRLTLRRILVPSGGPSKTLKGERKKSKRGSTRPMRTYTIWTVRETLFFLYRC